MIDDIERDWFVMVIVALLFSLVMILITIMLIRMNIKLKKEIIKVKDGKAKTNVNNEILKDWLFLRQQNLDLTDWIISNDLKRIAIYGYGILGKAFLAELENSSIEVVCVADKNFKNIHINVPTVSPDSIPDCDAVIITVVNYYDDIEKELLNKCHYPIISLEDIVYGVGYKIYGQ